MVLPFSPQNYEKDERRKMKDESFFVRFNFFNVSEGCLLKYILLFCTTNFKLSTLNYKL